MVRSSTLLICLLLLPDNLALAQSSSTPTATPTPIASPTPKTKPLTVHCDVPQRSTIQNALKISALQYFSSRCPDCTRVRVRASLLAVKPVKQSIDAEILLPQKLLSLEIDKGQTPQPFPSPSQSESAVGVDFKPDASVAGNLSSCTTSLRYRIITSYTHGNNEFDSSIEGEISAIGVLR